MAFSPADIVALERAIATGALRCRMSNGEEVQYRSLAEMRTILRLMKDEVEGTAPGGVLAVYPTTSRGL